MYQHLSSDEQRIINEILSYVKTESENEHIRRTASQRSDLDNLLYEVQDLMGKYPDDQDVADIYTRLYRLLY